MLASSFIEYVARLNNNDNCSESARNNDILTLPMTAHNQVPMDRFALKMTRRRRSAWPLRWVITLISISIDFSIASKPGVTTMKHYHTDYHGSKNPSDHKPWSALQHYDFPGLSQQPTPSNEEVESLTEFTNDTSDLEDCVDNAKMSRGTIHPFDHITNDHSQRVRSLHHKQLDKNVEPRQVQRLLRLPCSLSLRHEGEENSIENHSHGSHSRTPVSTFIDTGATHTVLTFAAAKRAGFAHLIDSRYAGHASGVAGVTCRVLGRVPSNTVTFIFHLGGGDFVSLEQSPMIIVLEDISNPTKSDDDRIDMLIGLDLLEEWQATISLRSRDLRVRQRASSRHGSLFSNADEDIRIPFQTGNTHIDEGNQLQIDDRFVTQSNSRSPLNLGEKRPRQFIASHAREPTDDDTGGKFGYNSVLLGADSDSVISKPKTEPRYKGFRNAAQGKVEEEVLDEYSDEGQSEDFGCDMSGV